MALYLTRTADKAGHTLGSGADQGFTDISGYSAAIQTAINQLKQMGVTTGTTATTYSPDDNVTREEMSLFLTRFLKKATPGPGGNTEDVSTYGGPTEIKSNDTDTNFTDLANLALWESQTSVAAGWMVASVSSQSPSTEVMPSPSTSR